MVKFISEILLGTKTPSCERHYFFIITTVSLKFILFLLFYSLESSDLFCISGYYNLYYFIFPVEFSQSHLILRERIKNAGMVPCWYVAEIVWFVFFQLEKCVMWNNLSVKSTLCPNKVN